MRQAPQPVIDADSHVFELAPGMIDWTKYLPEDRKQWSPKTFPFATGSNSMLVQGELWGVHFLPGRKEPERDPMRLFAGRKGMTDPKTRLEHMDQEGVQTSALFGSYLGRAAGAIRDPVLSRGVCMAYNDWLASFCKANPVRLKAVAEVPMKDPDMAAEEAKRGVRELGMVGVVVPQNVEGRSLDDTALYGSVFSAAEAMDVPVCVHPTRGAPPIPAVHQQRVNHRFYSAAPFFPFERMVSLACLLAGGLLERHPKVRVGLLEGWCSWVPFWLDRLENAYASEAAYVPAAVSPKELWASGQCYATAEPDETTLASVVERTGEDQWLFATDYWHPQSRFPDSVKLFLERVDLPDRLLGKLLSTNARRFYNLADLQ